MTAKALEAQVGSSLKIQFRDRNGTLSLVSGKALHLAVKGLPAGADRDVATTREFLRGNRKLFGLDDPDRELAVTKRNRDRLNYSQVRLEQTYQGLPVWPSELLVHLDLDGNVHRANGSLIRTPRRLPTNPTVVKNVAVQLARAAVEATVNSVTSEPQLIIYSSDEQTPRLAWKMEIEVGLAARWLVVLDAQAGTILTKFNQITDAAVTGHGVDLFGVTQDIELWEEDGTYYLIDASKPMFNETQNPTQAVGAGAIYVLDAANTPDDPYTQQLDSLFPFTSQNPASWAVPDAVSAAYGLSQTYDYYLERHGRDSIDGEGGTMIAVVRVGSDYLNASWDGSKMRFGDAQPYAGALDVVGHELTHGVIQHSANLVYQGQSGALNEAFADILGEMVEARTEGGADWALGSRLVSPIRNMRDPSIFDQPTTMSEYVVTLSDGGGVHTNSGIINRSFYLLAEGLPGAIGISDAEQIYYRALTVHLFKNARFIDARHACIAAAEELFGSSSSQATKVAEAFDTVEIFDAAASAPPASFGEIDAPDSTLFVFYDAQVGYYRLGRRETEMGDGALGAFLSQYDAGLTRPAVSGDGELAVFVDSYNDVCMIPTDGSLAEECLGFQNTFYSIAMSPQGNQFAAVFLDEFGEPDNTISIIDVQNEANTRDILLRAPLIDGGGAVQVNSADALVFSSTGNWLFYDAFTEVDIGSGLIYGTWSIYAIDLTSDLILSIVPPFPGIDFAYPSLSKSSDRFLVFDALDFVSGVSYLFTMDLFTGDLTTVSLVDGDYGIPSFSGDDSAIVYSYPDGSSTGLSLVRQRVDPESMQPIGDPTVWLEDADFGVIYRRGTFEAPSETDSCPNDPSKTDPGICGCGIPDVDEDGDGMLDGFDGCPDDADKTAPGECGCGIPDEDRDGDGMLNCLDDCPDDADKDDPGECGCGVAEGTCGGSAPRSTGCGAGVGMIAIVIPIMSLLCTKKRQFRPALGSTK